MNETMQREIRAQGEILPAMLPHFAGDLANLARPQGRILAGGCGDSAFAPAALAGFFADRGLDLRAATAMEIASFMRFSPDETVVLSSISGNTRRTAEAAATARRAGARVVALTCGRNSLLAKAADETILLPFTPISRKTPHTLDYTATLLALAVLALAWTDGDAAALAPALAEIPAFVDAGLAFADDLLPGMGEGTKLLLLGGGPDLATAAYGAAKFHEAGGGLAIAAETENFIHGMNFMLEPGDTLVAVATSPASLRRGAEVAEAFRGFVPNARVLRAAAHGLGGPAGSFADLLSVTIALQLLCWRHASRFGLAVEQPRAGRPLAAEHVAAQSLLMSR